MTRTLILSSLFAMLAGCAGAIGSDTAGEAQATIKQVPAQVACVQIIVAGSRTVERDFDVVAGQSSGLSLPGLPTGAVVFTGAAFGAACSGIAGATPSWQSAPVSTVLAAGAVTPVSLLLVKSGAASVGVDFQDDDGGVTLPVDLGVKPADLASFPTDLGCVPLTKAVACAGQTCDSAGNGCGGVIGCGTCLGPKLVCDGQHCVVGPLP